MDHRRTGAVVLAALLIFAACGTEEPSAAEVGSTVEAGTVITSSTVATAIPATTPATTLAAITTTTSAPSTTTTTTMPTTEHATPDEALAGPGVDHEDLIAALAPLVDAENAMHAFEADWDAGMTYSETFRGWREVKAIVGDAFDGFALPADASAEQIHASDLYIVAVQEAHDEWQAVTDFIVTYITNYTPEVFILNAYSEAEFRLRDAIAAYDAIEALGT